MCLLAKFFKQLLKVIAGYKGKIILVRRKNSDFLPHDFEFEFCFVSRCLATPVTASPSPTPTRWKPTVPDLSLALSYQVLPLTYFFTVFLFVKKSLICLVSKSMTPCRGNFTFIRSSHQLLPLRLGPLKGFLS